jgi:hypothetical protein
MVIRTQRLPSPIPSVPDPAVQEVLAVTVLAGRRNPELINDDEKLLEYSFVGPDTALADVFPALFERNSFRFPPASRANPSLGRNAETE